jgi:hypothetical protein
MSNLLSDNLKPVVLLSALAERLKAGNDAFTIAFGLSVFSK